jgi:hypothetical protein
LTKLLKNGAAQGSLFTLPKLKGKSLTVAFTGHDVSSDGGLLLLRQSEQHTGIIDAISACLTDNRHQSYTAHSFHEMLSQRVFQIASGYEDADDCDSLRGDDMFKISCGRLPSDNALSSQPTMSRFENTPGNRELYRIAEAFLHNFIGSYTQEPEVIILDVDDTNSETHGAQQLALFNQFYGGYCLMPLHIYEGGSGKLVTTILKPGSRSKSVNVFGILRRVVQRLRAVWNNTTIIVRGDSHFCSHQFMDWCTGQAGRVHFLTGLSGNVALHKLADTTIRSAGRLFAASGQPVKRYHSFEYKAKSWTHPQRVIVKVEVSSMGTNIRYVVTDMRGVRTQSLYENGYCARGAMELRIKEHKLYLKSDRMSCHRFKANQFRLFLHSAAYVLMHTLQTELLAGTALAKVTFKTLREKVIKVAAYVRELKSRISIELPASCPQQAVMARCLSMFALRQT